MKEVAMDFIESDRPARGITAKANGRWRRGVAGAVALWGIFTLVEVGLAQTTNISSSGLGTTITQTGPIHDITGGTRRGANLFHSFGFFNVGTGDTANFLNDTGLATSNIVGRVIGGQTSSVYGTIKTTDFGKANLFLINPFGFIFGNGASLDVGGSFHASTADYLKFSDGVFAADNSPLPASGLTANPLAFGFLGSPLCAFPCISVVDGSNLRVPDGQTLSLVGGDVQVASGSTLSAPSGRIQIGSFASAGEATVDGLSGSFASLGRIEISGGSAVSAADVDGEPASINGGSVLLRGGQVDILGSSLDVSGIQSFDADGNLLGGTAGGTVVIRGGRLFVEGSSILAQTMGNDAGAQIGIDVQMDESITLAGGSFLLAATSGPGRGGDIQMAAGQVAIDGAGVASASFGGEGVAGDVSITGDAITFANGGSIQSVVESITGVGKGGDITVNAVESISISGASGLFSVTNNAGTGGNISISAPAVTIDGGGTTVASLGSFGEGPGGTSGAISIQAGNFSLTGGALLNSVVSTTSPGVSAQAGNVTVLVDGDAVISGAGTGIVSSASQAAPEDLTVPASILLQAGTLQLTDGALIQAGTFADNGQGGNVTVRASDSMVISGGAGISSQSFNADVGAVEVSAKSLTIDGGFINTGTLGAGNAGDISIDVGTLALNNGGQIASSSGANAAGSGGNISINATGAVTISGSSPNPVLPEPFAGFVQNTSSGIFSTTATVGSGGNIQVQAKSLTLSDGGTISASSSGTATTIGGSPGNAGNINIVGETLNMDNGTITVATLGEGNAGNVLLNVGSLTQTGGARIESSSAGAGQGGNVTLAASGSVSISDVESGLFSTASSTGNAGEIGVSTPTLTIGDGGRISVATEGAGNAGNILANVSNFVFNGGARIDSGTTGAGAGGAITVTATEAASIAGPGSGLFSTASSTGNAGRISVTTPTLAMNNGGTISVATEGAGAAGNISLSLSNLTLDSGSQIASSTTGGGAGGTLGVTAGQLLSISGSGSGLFSTASSTGNAGEVTVSTPNLAMSNGAISVATSGAGNAGNVLLNVSSFSLTGGAQILSSTISEGQGGNVSLSATDSITMSGQGTGLFSTAASTGNAGQISVATPRLTMGEGGTISVATSGAGNAGNIALNVTNFTQTGGSRVDSSTSGSGSGGDIVIVAANSASISGPGTGLFSTASSTGAGGDINVQAPQVQILDGATMSANSTGTATATAGNVNIVTSDLTMQSGRITTEATLADGGNISITTTGSMVYLTDSQITTSVASGIGSGGNITIGSGAQPFDFIILNDSQIRADAFGGPGGNINIFANVFLPSDSIVSASSALSTSGTIDIQATFTDVSGSVIQLPETPLQATELLRASCAAKFAGGKASSLVHGGRDGLPLQPGGLLPSPLYFANKAGAPASISGYDLPRFSFLQPANQELSLNQYSLLANARCS